MVRSVASFYKVFLYTSFVFLLWLLSFFSLFAQTEPVVPAPIFPQTYGDISFTNLPSLPPPTPIAVCLAQSLSSSVVFSSLSHLRAIYQPGDTISVSAKAKNTLLRPLSDGIVFVRLSRVDDDTSVVIFEKILVSDLSLSPGQEKQLELSLDLPRSTAITRGNYRADFYILDNDGRLSLSTSPLFDSVHNIQFSLSGPVNGLYFQTSATQIGGGTSRVILEPLSLGEPVTLTQVIANDSTQSRSLSVNYEIFYQDNFVKGEALNRYTDVATLLPKEKKSISYIVPVLSAGSYYARVTLMENGQTIGTEGLRFTVGNAMSRLRYSGSVFSREGREPNLVACLASEATTTAILSISVIDQKGKTLVASSTQGSALLLPLSQRHIDRDVTMVTEVKNAEGMVFDRMEKKISCQEAFGCNSVSPNNIVYIVIGFFAVLLLALIFRFFLKRTYA